MPGHAGLLSLKNNDLTIWKYWELPKWDEKFSYKDENVLSYELEVLLGKSVERQLVADVPVGILLSGGIDPSLITALACKSNSSCNTIYGYF